MQIDFHHAVTYILARWAGFEHPEADVIAYSAQYVDNATYAGAVEFEGGQRYCRTASAHEMLDAKNLNPIDDIHSWVPFHFLPGNGGNGPGHTPSIPFAEQLVCTPNTLIAREMLDNCLSHKDSSFGGLHLLGITMHVFADTWAHQKFAGFKDDINAVHDLDAIDIPEYKEIEDRTLGLLAPNLGHGSASCYPDRPFLRWQYTNHAGLPIVRNNTEEFLEAAQHMLEFMTIYNNAPKAPQIGYSEVQAFLKQQFVRINSNDETDRHKDWVNLLETGAVPYILKTPLGYSADGATSWKFQAVGDLQALQQSGMRPVYSPEFLNRNWKKFHDALQYHRLYVLNDLLPKYGICAA